MDTDEYIDFLNELDDFEQTDNFIDKDKRRQRFPPRNPKKLPDAAREFVHTQDDSRSNFKFTYKAARFEEWWLLDSLGGFYEQQWITDVLRRVKGGKEASVYQCRAGVPIQAELVAAKVYRPRSLRNLRNDGLYREGRHDLDENGRQIFDDGMLHAMEQKTEFGRELQHQSWIAYEFTTMQVLRAAGADVPEPYTMAPNAILMGYVGAISAAAPALSEVRLEASEASELFERTIRNIDILLAHDRIHGDLSAYNILYWEGEITLIDFPQVVSPRTNPHAYKIFRRDVKRVCEYFSAQGVRTDADRLAAELWTAHSHRTESDPAEAE
ncbi:MAG TPA: RIO1 family regulatory kinase/ATPase [Burkholderiales bacterium]|nr:RIO1 family regulatory kinase/ATPase [Burkholderiales bacterium]